MSVSSTPPPNDATPSFIHHGGRYELSLCIQKDGTMLPISQMSKADRAIAFQISKQIASSPQSFEELVKTGSIFKKIEHLDETEEEPNQRIAFQTAQATKLVFTPDAVYEEKHNELKYINVELQDNFEKAKELISRLENLIPEDLEEDDPIPSHLVISLKQITTQLEDLSREITSLIDSFEKMDASEGNEALRNLDSEIKKLIKENSENSPDRLLIIADDCKKYIALHTAKEEPPAAAVPEAANKYAAIIAKASQPSTAARKLSKAVKEGEELRELLEDNYRIAHALMKAINHPAATFTSNRINLNNLEIAYKNLVGLQAQWKELHDTTNHPAMDFLETDISGLIKYCVSLKNLANFINAQNKILSKGPKEPFHELIKNHKFLSNENFLLFSQIPAKTWKAYEDWVNTISSSKDTELPKHIIDSFLKAIKNENPQVYTKNLINLTYELRQMLIGDREAHSKERPTAGDMEQVD